MTKTALTITQEGIEKLLAASTFIDQKLGEKSTTVLCVLPNGFQVIESSSCVDPLNYDHALGVEYAKKKIAAKLWELEGYRLQCANAALKAHLARRDTEGVPPMTEALRQARKALSCLSLEVEPEVQASVTKAVEAAFTALGAPLVKEDV